MCKAKVFYSQVLGEWVWNCLEHRKVVRDFALMGAAISSAELHVTYHQGMITQNQLIQTTISKIEMQGNPRLVYAYDQFLAEVKATSDVNVRIDDESAKA